MTRHLRPKPYELVAALIGPGDAIRVDTERGTETVRGTDPTDPYPEVKLALVPYSPAEVGWGETHSVTWGVGPGDARTPTGLRAPVLRRILRGHKLDEETWADARRLLGGRDRAVYVRIGEVGYFTRKRLAAIEARTDEEPS